MSNIYYDPDKFGLRIVGEVEWSDGCYQFDTSVVWQDVETGAFYIAHDSGCSCPSPFESIGRDDLTKIERMQDAIDWFEDQKRENYNYRPDDPYTGDVARIDGAIGELIQKIGAAR